VGAARGADGRARPAGQHDGRVARRVTAVSPTTVRFSVSVIESGGAVVPPLESAPVAAGAWHHVLASLSAPNLRLWVDGARTEIDSVSPVDAAFDTLRLGGDYAGLLDEVWIAQTPFTTDEAVLQRYCPAP